MKLLLARTSPPHNLAKSDLEDTMGNLSRLTAAQQAVLTIPAFPLHPMATLSFLPIPIPFINHTTRSLEAYFAQEAAAAGMFKKAGIQLIADFFGNTVAKKTITYGNSSLLSDVVGAHGNFQKGAQGFEQIFFSRLGELAVTLGRPLKEGDVAGMVTSRPLQAPSLPFFTIGDPLGILGSFQQIDVWLTSFFDSGPTIQVTLEYHLFDHFGCDDSDLTGLPSHGTPGQIAMWLLARDPSHAPGHKPFVVEIVRERPSVMLKSMFRTCMVE